MKKARLLIIHRALAPYRIELFNALNERFDCRFYFEYDVAREQPFQRQEIDSRRSFRYEILPEGLWGIKNLRTVLVGIVKDFRPDIILCSEFNLITPILLAAKYLFCPSARLVNICDDNERMAADQVQRGNTKSMLLNAVDGVVCCDQRTMTIYSERYAHGERFHYLPIIQDESVLRASLERALPMVRPLRSKLTNGDDQARLLLFVGRLAPEKNLPSLLRILSELIPAHPHLYTTLVGDGSEEQVIRMLIERYGLARRVLCVGKHEGDELMAYYAAADFFVLPSIIERFGAVANEALIAGLRVCCSHIAGIAPMIGAEQGSVFDPLNGQDFLSTLTHEIQKAQMGAASSGVLRPSLMPISFRETIEAFCNYLILLKH